MDWYESEVLKRASIEKRFNVIYCGRMNPAELLNMKKKSIHIFDHHTANIPG